MLLLNKRIIAFQHIVVAAALLMWPNTSRSQNIFTCHLSSPNALKSALTDSGEIDITATNALRESQLSLLKKNPSEFCQRNMLMRYLNSKPDFPAPENCSTLSIQELETKADELRRRSGDSGSYSSSWNNSLIPTKSAQEEAVKASMKMALGGPWEITFNTADTSLTGIQDYLSDPKNMESFSSARAQEMIKRTEQNTIPSMQSLAGSVGPVTICASMTLIHARQCSKGLDFVIKEMTPKRGAGQMTALFAWKRISEDNLKEGIRLAGLKIIGRLKAPTTAGVNIFDDIKNAFKESGLNDERSTDAAFDLLMVVSNGGANTAQRAVELYGSNSVSVSLGIIGAGLSGIDYERSKSGLPPYSMPSSVKAGCLYQKPYHFWMAAAEARYMVKTMDLNKTAAAYATFASAKGYAINRDLVGGGNKGLNTIFNKQPFDPVHQVMRMDFTYAAAGAVFGANYDSKPNGKFDIDAGLSTMVTDAATLRKRLSNETGMLDQLGKFREWDAMFSPNSAIKDMLAQAEK